MPGEWEAGRTRGRAGGTGARPAPVATGAQGVAGPGRGRAVESAWSVEPADMRPRRFTAGPASTDGATSAAGSTARPTRTRPPGPARRRLCGLYVRRRSAAAAGSVTARRARPTPATAKEPYSSGGA
ncbi:hypothetical protein GCM10010385_31100 [Streptomyces geysiriensis]|nr:hypothetical protein GCM10010385_31100 [Streptomyces geysiriensis]